MKAIAYTMPGIKLIDIPEPQITSEGQVKVKVHYASICGSDIHTVKGEADGHFQELGFKPGQPIVIGHEASGEIVEPRYGRYRDRHGGRSYRQLRGIRAEVLRS